MWGFLLSSSLQETQQSSSTPLVLNGMFSLLQGTKAVPRGISIPNTGCCVRYTS